MFIITPDMHVIPVQQLISGLTNLFPFLVSVVSEEKLFVDPSSDHSNISILKQAYPYAIQMAVKLLISRFISTSYYLTLDADLIMTHKFLYSDLVRSTGGDDNSVIEKAVYQPESRQMHPKWWEGSHEFLSIPSTESMDNQGFSVTPALLSTYGALVTLEHIRDLYGASQYLEFWLTSFGHTTLWSEYTLYRIVLDHYEVMHNMW
jgi:hypothetical protein